MAVGSDKNLPNCSCPPAVKLPEAVALPAQAKLPVALVIVQPVDADPPPMRISPVPVLFKLRAAVLLISMDKATVASSPVAARVRPFAVAELVIVNWLTAVALESKISISFPDASAKKPKSVNLGAVRVLPDNVSVPARVAKVPVVGRVTEVVPDTVRVVA